MKSAKDTLGLAAYDVKRNENTHDDEEDRGSRTRFILTIFVYIDTRDKRSIYIYLSGNANLFSLDTTKQCQYFILNRVTKRERY
jgi:hypothetical protein